MRQLCLTNVLWKTVMITDGYIQDGSEKKFCHLNFEIKVLVNIFCFE
jgi:hypothetical protein